MTDLSFLIFGLAVVAIILLLQRWRVRPRFRKRSSGSSRSIDVEGDLLIACRGDKSMAERLVQHEMKRKPELSRTGAALMALSRLRDDRR